jgi:subtilisin family serine protease
MRSFGITLRQEEVSMAKKKATSQRSSGSAAEGPAARDFRQQLGKTVIALPLIDRMRGRGKQAVVIDLNFNHHEGLAGAKLQTCRALAAVLLRKQPPENASLEMLLDQLSAALDKFKTRLCAQYVFAELTPSQIRRLLEEDDKLAAAAVHSHPRAPDITKNEVVQNAMRPYAYDVEGETRASKSLPLYRGQSIYKIWPDFDAEPMLQRTISTVKADAARISFSATGRNIVWAVIDSGIDASHPHFRRHRNLELQPPLRHADFTKSDGGDPYVDVPTDDFGHGTHVAGIIAGEIDERYAMVDEILDESRRLNAVTRVRDNQGRESYESWPISRISGIAPECKLLSLKVLDERGRGNHRASNILAALAYINELNAFGRNVQIHGVNLSVGYEFEAEWFGCGQSPLCIEVNRLVRSGVVVVAAAGNTGYGAIAPSAKGPNLAGLSLTINDPGNADRAITVGSTHRYMPQQYGISYFSSKGPTGDGRLKPDLVAPGENVLSCAAGRKKDEIDAALAKRWRITAADLPAAERCSYREESGTSMAAPHVSGAIAAFLSIRPGYIGRPDEIKKIFLSTATDLGRQRDFQGHGLVDLMRAIQSV